MCGILCESGICKDNNFIVVGIGLNLYCEAFADEIRDVAGCVFKTPKTQEFEALTAKIIDNFFEIYNTNDFLEYYKNKCFVLGKEISVIKNGSEIKAFALDIDNKCRLKVRYNNREELLSTGEISIKLKELWEIIVPYFNGDGDDGVNVLNLILFYILYNYKAHFRFQVLM